MTAAAVIQPRSSGDDIASALRASVVKTESDAAACLVPLLKAMHWHGNSRDLLEALPHYGDDLNLADLRNVLAHLGFRTTPRAVEQGTLDPRLAPCLFQFDGGGLAVILDMGDGRVELYDAVARENSVIDRTKLQGTAYPVSQADVSDIAPDARQMPWLRGTLMRFGKSFGRLFAITFGLNILALSVPLFIMAVYDQVVPAQSGRLLVPLAFGMFLALGLELLLRIIRARSLAFIGGRLEHLVRTSVFGKLLSLPAHMTESAPMGAQLARLKEFDSLRDTFTGTLATVILELPFVLLFIGVIALIAGPLALVPLGLLAALVVIGGVMIPRFQRQVAEAAKARADRHGFVMEAVNNLRSVADAGAQPVWRERYRELSAKAALAQRRSGSALAVLEAVGQVAMTLGGVATIAIGATMAMDGAISVGALIAVMALTWRVLSPINALFLASSRLGQVAAAASQINRLMAMPGEQVLGRAPHVGRVWRGDIAFSRVSLRYQAEAEPALLGVNFRVEPGELVAITGANGSGKSSILRLVLGLYRPQAGQVSLDGQDIRQIAPAELRHAIAYVPQQSHFFHGTIAQNLRLANPLASEEELVQALHGAGLLKDVVSLPDGLQTRLGDQMVWQFNAGFRQRLALARAYVKRAPILLLDEPAQALDDQADAALVGMLERLRGQATILMVSHRPSHIRLADRVLVLDQGVLAAEGKPRDILKSTPKGGLKS
ncbi:MAG: peptidase domain-containing ABC transporter [Alphaproteobacteria bacterium]|nr:MAG: peptidase domain-containing ABC transporter [Alphaproteobacteria bacterium]